MRRRDFLATVTAAGALAAAAPASAQTPAPIPRKGRIKQGAFRNVFGDTKMSLEDQCREAARIGLKGFDLIQPQDWPTLKKFGLVCTLAPSIGVTFQDGLIHPEVHDALEKTMRGAIDVCSANGVTNMISVGGQRRGMSYAQATDNAVAYLNRIKKYAEDKGVTISPEIMNTRYPDNLLGRPDQVFDHLNWGIEVCKRVNSPNVKIVFDIYHVQIADGNVAANIRDNIQWISHFHTAGVPGRNEIDDTQELNYRFIARTIADLNFTGYVSHEYRPSNRRDPIKTLEQVVEIMDV